MDQNQRSLNIYMHELLIERDKLDRMEKVLTHQRRVIPRHPNICIFENLRDKIQENIDKLEKKASVFVS